MVFQRLWQRFVQGRLTVSEIEDRFKTQFSAVKMIVYEFLTAEFVKGGVPSIAEQPMFNVPAVMAAQIVEYTTGGVFDPGNEQMDRDAREFAASIQADLPEIVDNILRQDRNLREAVVYTARMRAMLGVYRSGDAFWTSPTSCMG